MHLPSKQNFGDCLVEGTTELGGEIAEEKLFRANKSIDRMESLDTFECLDSRRSAL